MRWTFNNVFELVARTKEAYSNLDFRHSRGRALQLNRRPG